jgi:hypothetical protein
MTELVNSTIFKSCVFTTDYITDDIILTFGDSFTSDINVIFPDWINVVIFGERFNKSLLGVIWPISMHTIKLGMIFNHDITLVKWPSSLHTLILGYAYEQDISNLYIPSLKILDLGGMYQRNVRNIKWSELNSLKLSEEFNQDITGIILPQSLHTLTFGHAFAQDISKVNFQNINTIKDYSNKITIDSCKFPNTLKYIIHYTYIEKINVCIRNIIYERPTGMYTKGANVM